MGEASTSLRCFRYGGLVQHATDFKIVGVIEVILFPEPEESVDQRFIYVSQIVISLRDNDQELVMFIFLEWITMLWLVIYLWCVSS